MLRYVLEIAEIASGLVGVVLGLFVLGIIVATSMSPLGKRYRRFHRWMIVAAIFFQTSLFLSIVAALSRSPFVWRGIHHVLLFFVVVAFGIAFHYYRKEAFDDLKLRGLE